MTTFVPLFVLLGLIAVRLRVVSPRQIRADLPALLVVVAVAAAIGGWLAFPSEPERMLVGSFLVVVTVLACSDRLGRGAGTPASTEQGVAANGTQPITAS